MARRGHVPFRLCAGCGRRVAKRELVRFTVQGDGREVVLDREGARAGRGAYLCASFSCFEQALKKKSLLRRLRAAAVTPDLKEDFMRLLENAGKKE